MLHRLLIADDQPAILHILRRELEHDSFLQVCGEAVDGADAVAKAKELQPDLIVLDLTMPGMSGLEAAGEIIKQSPGIPILLFTLFNTPDVRLQAAKAGIRAVISKADGIKPLRAAIETAIESKITEHGGGARGSLAGPQLQPLPEPG